MTQKTKNEADGTLGTYHLTQSSTRAGISLSDYLLQHADELNEVEGDLCLSEGAMRHPKLKGLLVGLVIGAILCAVVYAQHLHRWAQVEAEWSAVMGESK